MIIIVMHLPISLSLYIYIYIYRYIHIIYIYIYIYIYIHRERERERERARRSRSNGKHVGGSRVGRFTRWTFIGRNTKRQGPCYLSSTLLGAVLSTATRLPCARRSQRGSTSVDARSSTPYDRQQEIRPYDAAMWTSDASKFDGFAETS